MIMINNAAITVIVLVIAAGVNIIKEPKISTGDSAIQSAAWYQGKL
jgi:hypothetical protein